ncbi:MAG: ABC transporter ATP-binding protein, partial [Clostridia bacterium]|nr:ABC transporter ATP-binding protein [Clostridia bacterium]
MLELKNIKKDYDMADTKVHALKGVSLSFRESEFVSILGPSGCGKTTLLNIIGGLDRYTSGDLIINGVSTKEYKDKDWDTYRNHSIGFVFQSYNLIPHQTVLENVELALTLSGISKAERKERATKVLEQVGLGDKLSSKPNQLSGGQMQRVAIARALVNNPDIILADEPTGALDTGSSVQIMEILKEISKEKLIIMVTHNPELAEKYSTRIVKLLDGELTADSKPYKPTKKKVKSVDKGKKKSMSFFTALSLSFKNLLTKKARTTLVMFAGSIGIIGIALILAISSGFNTYVNKMQQDTLSNYPIQIQSKSVDFTSVIQSMFMNNNTSDSIDHNKDGIYPKENISSIINSVGGSSTTNNLNKFHTYLEEHKSEIEPYINGIQYSYSLSLTEGTGANTIVSASDTIMQMIEQYAVLYVRHNAGLNYEKIGENYKLIGSPNIVVEGTEEYEKFNSFFNKYSPDLDMIKNQLILSADHSVTLNQTSILYLSFKVIGVSFSGGGMGGMSFNSRDIFNEMLDNSVLLDSQYTLVGENSRWASSGNEAMIVLDKNSELDDYVLYALGLLSEEQVDSI